MAPFGECAGDDALRTFKQRLETIPGMPFKVTTGRNTVVLLGTFPYSNPALLALDALVRGIVQRQTAMGRPWLRRQEVLSALVAPVLRPAVYEETYAYPPWFADPRFERLVEEYAEAYACTPEEFYKEVVLEKEAAVYGDVPVLQVKWPFQANYATSWQNLREVSYLTPAEMDYIISRLWEFIMEGAAGQSLDVPQEAYGLT